MRLVLWGQMKGMSTGESGELPRRGELCKLGLKRCCVLVWAERGWETGLLIRRNRTHRVGMECRRILKVGQEVSRRRG